MSFSKALHRHIYWGGTLASFGVLLFLSGADSQAQDWSPSPGTVKMVIRPTDPGAPLPPPSFPIIDPVAITEPVMPPKTLNDVAAPAPNPVTNYNEAIKTLETEQVAVGTKKLSLQECIALALEKQPALAAARASLGAATEAYNGLNDMNPLFGLLSRDLSIRKQQACLGIQISQAGLTQAEWDTRYAVTRNYFSVVYARQQSELVQRVVLKLERAHERAKKLSEVGDPKIKVNAIDVAALYLAREKTKARGLEASIGVSKALAALHEAIGLANDQPLDIADAKMPELVGDLQIKELIAQALSQRGEMSQAQIAAQVTDLEVSAQKRIWFKPSSRTFASGADLHATQIPQGLQNGEYRPAAIPPEMAANLYGPRWVRMERARFFSARADAVVDKTENLISLETKVAYWKWKEAAERLKLYLGDPKVKDGSLTAKADWIAEKIKIRFDDGAVSGEDYLKAAGAADITQIEFNEAVYNHALGLAALERVTAGGYRLAGGQP